jgi:hypothetical protein
MTKQAPNYGETSTQYGFDAGIAANGWASRLNKCRKLRAVTTSKDADIIC